MNIDDAKLKEILLNTGYVDEGDLEEAEKYASTHNTSVLHYLFENSLVTHDLLGQAIAEHFQVPYADLNSNMPAHDQVIKIPEELARSNRVVLFREAPGSIILTTDNPQQETLVPAVLTALQITKEHTQVSVYYSLPQDIDAILVQYRKTLATRFSKILGENARIAPELLTEIFSDARVYKASDIHFEPQEKTVQIRFRIDGVLQKAGELSRPHYDNILNRIKVMAHMRIDEHFAAQDGALRFQDGEITTDMRISVVPTIDGEKLVIRLLTSYLRSLTLSDIGLSKEHQQILDVAVQKPFGMILSTGPTGSGKTTTLYGVLKRLNSPDVNVSTIEDPVEYKIAGVNHIQVNLATKLTFAKGLRSIVRQDPDIILVGEIRDEETADIAVNAALTGHLLLSTFHANDAATAIPRLLDMGIEPFLLASTLDLIMAQRLVRRICEQCRYSYMEELATIVAKYPHVSDYYDNAPEILLYKGKGCVSCNHTGYQGRIGIFEIIRVSPEFQTLILTNPSAQNIAQLAREEGSRSLFEDGLDKVKQGVTTLEEVVRLAPPAPRIKINRPS